MSAEKQERVKDMGNANENGNNHHLLLDIPRPLPFGTRIMYMTPNKEVNHATVVEAGYYTLVVYNDDNSISIIGYADIISLA